MSPVRALPILSLAAAVFAGCAASAVNSSFPVTVDAAKADLQRIENDRRPLDRPVAILGGYADPGVGGLAVGSVLRKHIGQGRIITVSFAFCSTFDQCRQKVIETIDRDLPTDDPTRTSEVDAIGLSMGGLVARYAAAPLDGQRMLNVRRMFTVSSPHLGATRAQALPQMTQMQADMRPGSAFLQKLESAETSASYAIFPYTRLDDDVVGAHYAAPRGRTAWWVPNEPMQPAHIGAATDPRILADILRRLRGEKPLTRDPPAKIPPDER
jgi:hypothetical protein